MTPLSPTFTEKVLSKLDKLDRKHVERFVRGVVSDRQFYDGVFEALSEGVIVTDPEGRVLLINRFAREMLGVPRGGKTLGRPLLSLVRDEALADLLSGWTGERIDQREVPLELPVLCDLLVTLFSVRDEETDETAARVAILADVTEHRRRERERSRTERLSSLAVLTAGVAHEIKNPLNSLRIHAQLLEQSLARATWPDDVLPDRTRRSTEIILEETQRLARIVEQFMQAVRPVDPHLTRHNLNVIVRRVLDVVAPQEAQPTIAVELDLDPQLPDVWVDDQQIAQVFINLLRNAIESLDKPARRIRVSTRAVEGMAEVSVEDNGCGIKREDLERIYQPYYTTKFNGTGLGLMVVHRILEEHGGHIVIKSHEGEGTLITVLLPLMHRPQRLLAAAESEETAHAAP